MEHYISVDIEADGPIPGPWSMLSLGAAAYDYHGKFLDSFSVNLQTLQEAGLDRWRMDPHEDTVAFWKRNPEAWKACRENTVDPLNAMIAFKDWFSKYKNPIFVGYPAGFDFTFVYWYLTYFVGKTALSFSALDVKTLAMARMGGPYKSATKRNMPKRWFGNTPHSHIAVEDAVEQGDMCMKILKELREPGVNKLGTLES